MSVHLYTNGAWTDSGKIYRNSLQLLDWSLVESGTIDSETGQNVPWENAKRSDFMYIDGFIIISGYTGNLRVFTYDNAKNYITNFLYDSSFSLTNSYFRIAGPLTSMVDTIMINSGRKPLPFEPYDVVGWYTNNGHGYTSGAWS